MRDHRALSAGANDRDVREHADSAASAYIEAREILAEEEESADRTS